MLALLDYILKITIQKTNTVLNMKNSLKNICNKKKQMQLKIKCLIF